MLTRVPPTVALHASQPIPRPVGRDDSRSHHGADESPATAALYQKPIAQLEYRTTDGSAMRLVARAGDYDHSGHVVDGSFRDAVRVAREDSSVEVIDMEADEITAVLRNRTGGGWRVVPLHVRVPGTGPDGEEYAVSLDPAWQDDRLEGAALLGARAAHPDLVALVGVRSWINFGGETLARELRTIPRQGTPA